MNFPGHTGLTLGVFLAAGYLGDALVFHSYKAQSSRSGWFRRLSAVLSTPPSIFQRLRLDYRVILAGSLLPDFIDKPLGFFILPQLLDLNSRTVGHTLAFNLALVIIGMAALKLIRSGIPLVLAISSAGHLLFDQMWRTPQTLLWPLWGWSFPPGVPRVGDWIMYQLTGQWISFPEIIGLLVLAGFAAQLYRLRTIGRFFKTGRVDPRGSSSGRIYADN